MAAFHTGLAFPTDLRSQDLTFRKRNGGAASSPHLALNPSEPSLPPRNPITTLPLFHTISSQIFTKSYAHKASHPRRDPSSSSLILGDSRSEWVAWSVSSHHIALYIYCMNQHHHIHVVDFGNPFYESRSLSIIYYVMLHMTYSLMCMISEAGC